MPVTQADIDRLNAQIASVERQITHGDESVTFHTVQNLIEARNDLLRQMQRQALKPAPKQTYIQYGGRGYN